MKTPFQLALATGLLIVAAVANAVSPAAQNNINLMIGGGPESLSEAAHNIYDGVGADQEASDVLAEELLQNLDKSGHDYSEALSWSCKALANTRNKRYYSALKQAASGGDKKVRKYCDRAADDLGSAEGEQYARGMVSPGHLRAESHAAPAVHASSGHYQPITAATVDMSLQEAEDLVGPPTATTEHITGKAFIPFNFKGADTYRIIYLYKGQGRIIFSAKNQYTHNLRVLEVQVNPDESGYP